MLLKISFFKVLIVVLLILFASFSVLSSFVEVPKRPLREYATMKMALNQEKTESIRLKVPWGYLAPNISYMSLKDQQSFFKKAKSMMLLMGLSDVFNDSEKEKTEFSSLSKPRYATAYSIDVLYPNFESKNEYNIEQFVSKRGVIRKDIDVSVLSSAKGHYWNDWQGKILSSYNVQRNSLETKLSKSKSFKHYGFSLVELPGEYGLILRGLSVEAVRRLRADGLIEGAIPQVIWENRGVNGELLSYMRCMQPDKGWLCEHTMHVESINSEVNLSYHSSLLKDWKHIERQTRRLFSEFIELAGRHESAQ